MWASNTAHYSNRGGPGRFGSILGRHGFSRAGYVHTFDHTGGSPLPAPRIDPEFDRTVTTRDDARCPRRRAPLYQRRRRTAAARSCSRRRAFARSVGRGRAAGAGAGASGAAGAAAAGAWSGDGVWVFFSGVGSTAPRAASAAAKRARETSSRVSGGTRARARASLRARGGSGGSGLQASAVAGGRGDAIGEVARVRTRRPCASAGESAAQQRARDSATASARAGGSPLPRPPRVGVCSAGLARKAASSDWVSGVTSAGRTGAWSAAKRARLGCASAIKGTRTRNGQLAARRALRRQGFRVDGAAPAPTAWLGCDGTGLRRAFCGCGKRVFGPEKWGPEKCGWLSRECSTHRGGGISFDAPRDMSFVWVWPE